MSEDTIRLEASGTLRVLGADVGIHSHTMVKRFEEAGRTLILWCSIGESDASSGVEVSARFQIRESGLAVAREVRSIGASGGVLTSSVLETLVRLTPRFTSPHSSVDDGGASSGASADEESPKLQPGLLVDVAMGAHLRNMAAVYEKFENRLMS